ncbi:MAG: ribonuclease R [Defluviitaleaceae bacterium]|nr:ribonuclease R [Defluviitaleaceae bacterium]
MPKNKRKDRKLYSTIKTKPVPITIKGKFVGNERGFGFVIQEDTTAEDIFIPPSMTGGAIHGDEVLCRMIRKAEPVQETTQRQSAQVIEITQRKPHIGTYYTVGREGFVRPIEGKIPYVYTVSPKTCNRFGLADGHRVIFLAPKPKASRNDDYNSISATRPCSIVEVIGHIHDPGMDVLTLVYQAGIPNHFTEDSLNQAAGFEDHVSEGDINGRLDLRNQHIITIDGEDTKDIDDAISLTLTPNGNYQLGVHIADVSHYVKPCTPLDIEAFNRGTSVYLADRVIPMLPHRISSGICSLFAGVDRLTLSCMMTVDAEGHVIAYDIATSVINSKRRWTYHEVQEVLDKTENTSCADHELFTNMNRLREILYQKRHKRGALDFNLPEAKIRVDEAGHPISIEPYQRSHATGIIEEFMMLANETVATHCQNHNIPQIYRAHDAPTPEKLAMLTATTKSMGFAMPTTSAKPKAIQRLLKSAESSPAYHMLAMAVLTSLPHAIYTPASPRHFGLASEAYCHFTSPIRRYADLQVHRIIKQACTKTIAATTPYEYEADLAAISAQCSRAEREAETLEREVAQLKKVQFMRHQEGKIFEGTISGITPWGVYVMLANTIEGLLTSQYLKHQDFTHDKDKNIYVNRRMREKLIMGANISIRVAQVNEDERKLSFSLAK